ncbi:hypothetical protein ACS0TY_007737 [Phlomoides rotata]
MARRGRQRDEKRDQGSRRSGRDSEDDDKRSRNLRVEETTKENGKKSRKDETVKKGDVKENVGIDAVANLGRSGGVYIPPFKLARMMKEVEDKSSIEYQRMTWDALRKSINGLVNKVNATNIKNIIPDLFAENLIRGWGLFCRSCMKSQMASPGFTDVFAALVAVVNTKFLEVGGLLLRRIILQLQRAYKRNDKPQLLAAVKFIAHMVNQQLVHELIALELLTLLLESQLMIVLKWLLALSQNLDPCSRTFLLEDCMCVKGESGGFVVLNRFDFMNHRIPLHSMFLYLCILALSLTQLVVCPPAIFEHFRGILHEGEIDKRVQFLIEGQFALRKAKFQGYPAIRPELDIVEQEDQLTYEVSLLDEIDPEVALDIFKPDPQFSENEKRYEELKKQLLGEESEDEADEDEDAYADSDYEDDEESEEEDEEQMKITDETETNLERTYLRYYGLLGQRFCIFIKILFQELLEHLGIRLLNERLSDPLMQDSYDSIFPKDNPKNTRFAINFFTSIGLGGITENLREYLKNMTRLIMQQQKAVSESGSSSDSDSDGSESSSSSSSESESDDDRRRRKKRRN